MKSKLIVKNTKIYGRGVFSTQNIKKGSLLFKDHYLEFKNKDLKYGKETILNCYWYDNQKSCLLALGLGSLLNHNLNSNVECVIDEKNKVIEFYSTKSILKGEQLFLDYGYDPCK